MKIPDMWPNLGLLLGAVTMVTAVLPAQAAEPYVLGVCKTASESTHTRVEPTDDGNSYLNSYHNGDARYTNFDFCGDNVTITIVKKPSHGKLVLAANPIAASRNVYYYKPNRGYIGRDHFVMQLDKKGVKVQIEYLIKGLEEDEPETDICTPEEWKISAIISAHDNASLQARLNAVGVNHIFPFITNAVDHGWYIDYTPYLNKALRPSRILQSALQPKQA